MVIASYNVNGVNGRLPVLLRWLAEQKPDVVCLQELRTPDDKFPEQALLDAGYASIWHGQKSWNGVAVLTKKRLKPEEVGRGLPGDPNDEQSRYLEVKVKGIVVVHLCAQRQSCPGPEVRLQNGLARAPALKDKEACKIKRSRGAGGRLQHCAHGAGCL